MYTHKAGRKPALQQNWQGSEKITTFYGKNTIFKEHPVCKAQLISPRCLTGQDSKKNLKLCRGIMKCGRMWVLSNKNEHTRKKTYPLYKKLWLGVVWDLYTATFPAYRLSSPYLSVSLLSITRILPGRARSQITFLSVRIVALLRRINKILQFL